MRLAPAAVAPRRAEARDLALDDRDPQLRILCGQVVGGPEAREARAHDRDVDAFVTRERSARLDRLAQFVEPEARRSEGAIEGHGSCSALLGSVVNF